MAWALPGADCCRALAIEVPPLALGVLAGSTGLLPIERLDPAVRPVIPVNRDMLDAAVDSSASCVAQALGSPEMVQARPGMRDIALVSSRFRFCRATRLVIVDGGVDGGQREAREAG
jgi:hypothetical protein